MAASSDADFHPYMASEPCPNLKSGAPENDIVNQLAGLRWPSDNQIDIVAPTPGIQHHTALPASSGLPPQALPMESIFNEPVGSPRNLLELHRDRRYVKDITYVWVGSERHTIVRPTFKKTLPKPSVERFWCLSTLILDLGREHISAAYMTGEFWHSTDREAIRILTETAKLEPFRRFWKALTDDDFVAWMVGALVPGSNWNFAKAGVLQDPFSLYFAVCLSRYLSLSQMAVQTVAMKATIKAVATLETCGFIPRGISDPRTALAGNSARFANTVLKSLDPPFSTGETIHQRRVRLWQSESSLEVLQSVIIELGSYPIAHGLTRASKAPLEAPAREPPKIPYEAVAFPAAMVEARLRLLENLPSTNNQVIGTVDDDCKMPLGTHVLWDSHKVSVGVVTANLIAENDLNKANDPAPSASTSRAVALISGLAGQAKALTDKALRYAVEAQDAMKNMMASFNALVSLPVVDEQVPANVIAGILAPPDGPAV